MMGSGQERNRVKAVFTDVDGTLLNSKHGLDDATTLMLKKVMDKGIPVCMATGKARGPWVRQVMESMGLPEESWTLNGPSVFIQGLLVCNPEGKAIHRTVLDNPTVRKVNALAADRGVSLVSYTTDDRIVAAQIDEWTDLLLPYSEPTPQPIGRREMDLLGSEGALGAHKMMFMGPEEVLRGLRGEVEAALGDEAVVTKAVERMLEVLPPGASKGAGVLQALDMLGLRPGDCLALGDGENDLEMLEMVRVDGGVAVAMGNGVPKLKSAAEFVVATNDEGGAAEALQRFALDGEHVRVQEAVS